MKLLSKKLNYVDISRKLQRINLSSLGQIFFLIGIIFLASALPISLIFLLISIVISFKENKKNFLWNKWNIALLVTSIFMILSSFLRLIFPIQSELSYLAKNSWIDIMNWIPLFVSFHSFQFYLKTSTQRILCCKALIISTIPVIFSCISQYWFKVYGPFSTFFGLITWYQKPFENSQSGVEGLFSNPNYTGYWLSTILPLSLYFLLKNKSKKYNSFFISIITLLILYFLINTSSRNALISISFSTLLVFCSKVLFIKLLFLITIVLLIVTLNPTIAAKSYEFLKVFLPIKLLDKFTLFSKLDILSLHRLDVYKNALYFIFRNPLFGWGASTFGALYLLKSGMSPAGHTHNLILEIAYNYGIIPSLIITLFIFNLFFITLTYLKKDKFNKILFIDKIWLTSAISSIIFHMSDFPYYDGKVSILFWLLLAGINSINNEYKNIIFSK